MDETLRNALSNACSGCNLGGGCCMGAMPPLTQKRIDILLSNGIRPEQIEFEGYKRLRLKPDGFCVLFQNGKCSIHSFKPETCVAGPFTFDVFGDNLRIFLKKTTICPMVEFLKKDKEAYEGLFAQAVSQIVELIKGLPPEELAEIVKIDEPETELVVEIDISGLCKLNQADRPASETTDKILPG